MTPDSGPSLRDQATEWHVRIAGGSAGDWEAFIAWLEADPAHQTAFDAVEMAVAEADEALHDMARPHHANPVPEAANDEPANPSRRWWIGGALAASLAFVVAIGSNALFGSDPYQVMTGPGQTQTVTLPSGDRIALNGETRLTLDRKNPRYASLDQGEAVFTIRHDPSDPFVLYMGDNRVEDVGTVFSAAHGGEGIRVSVAEGAVLYNPDSEAVTLTAGRALHDAGGTSPIVVSTIDPSAVGAWQRGRLSYSGAPYSAVAADLGRAIGQRVILDPALAGRQFTGTIRIDQPEAQLFTDIDALLGVTSVHDKAGWRLAVRSSEGR